MEDKSKTYEIGDRPTLREELGDDKAGCIVRSELDARKHLDVRVVDKVYTPEHPWPGSHKNVYVYYRLTNGRLVGFNENPSIGWSFPVKMSE